MPEQIFVPKNLIQKFLNFYSQNLKIEKQQLSFLTIPNPIEQ